MTHHSPRARQRGLAALALALFVAGAAGLALLTAAGRGERAGRPAADAAVLARARHALLGYAASYPDRVNARFAPGYLPCPAPDRRGIAGPACSLAGGTTRGRFPWHTLRTHELRDAHGESLWYAIAEDLRYNPKRVPLDAAGAAPLALDGAPVVAVIVVPGPPVAGQGERRGRAREARQFLEGANADGDLTRYTARPAAPGNDRVLAVSRAELVAVAERRALAELRRGLDAWAAAHHGRLPWLAPPDGTGARVGVRRGHLAAHRRAGSAEPAAAPSFDTGLEATWSLDGARVAQDLDDGLLSPLCARRAPCPVGGVGARPTGRARCRWWAPAGVAPRRVARCRLESEQRRGGVTVSWTLDFALADEDGELELAPPTRTARRRRRVATSVFEGFGGGGPWHLEIELAARSADGREDRVRLAADEATRGHFAVAGIAYAPDADAGELATWLVDDGWLARLHLAWAEADCAARGDCLAVERRRAGGAARRDSRVVALLVAPGAPLPGVPVAGFEAATRAAFAGAGAYLDAPASARFNDRLLLLGRAP